MFGLWVMTSVFVPRSLLAADQPRGPHGALEAAGVALPDRNPRGLEHLADRFGVGATRVVHLALFGDVVDVPVRRVIDMLDPPVIRYETARAGMPRSARNRRARAGPEPESSCLKKT